MKFKNYKLYSLGDKNIAYGDKLRYIKKNEDGEIMRDSNGKTIMLMMNLVLMAYG